MTEALAHAAGTDAGNRSMRAAGRTAWNADDYHTAARAWAALSPHVAADPHCTCNDCLAAFTADGGEPDA